MFVYRIKTRTIAITRDEGKPTLITLSAGTEVRTPKGGPKLPGTGLVDIETVPDGRIAAMFAEDLEVRGERVEGEPAKMEISHSSDEDVRHPARTGTNICP